MPRSRKSRREEPAGEDAAFDAWVDAIEAGPEQEAMLADSVGLALLVVLDRLAPAERVAFVLHDMFGVPFGEIAGITGRSADAAASSPAGRGGGCGATRRRRPGIPASASGWPGSTRSPRRSSPRPGPGT